MAYRPLQTEASFDRSFRSRDGHPFSRRVGVARRWITFSILVSLVATIWGYWYLTDARRVRAMAESYLTGLLGAHVDMSSATLSLFEGLRLDDVTVRAFGGGEDTGWLVPFADRLEFVGDIWRVTLPRPVVTGVRRGPDFTRAGLGGAARDLQFRAPDGSPGRLRLQSREGDRLSETNAQALGDALDAWLAAPIL